LAEQSVFVELGVIHPPLALFQLIKTIIPQNARNINVLNNLSGIGRAIRAPFPNKYLARAGNALRRKRGCVSNK
jgi:hypothetical protein